MDPQALSLDLTIGPVVLKAATLAQQCHNIQANLPSAPSSLSAAATECTEIHQLLECFQVLGRQDQSMLGDETAKEISQAIGAVRKCYSKVLTSIEEHVELLEEFVETKHDGETHSAMKQPDFEWDDNEVQKILEESKQHRDSFDSLLKNLQLIVEHQRLQLSLDGQIPDIPIITEPPVVTQDPEPNISRFSIDSIATRDFAINPSRFSADSLSSVLSATQFDFDTETLSSSSYRQAFGNRVRKIISRPLNSPGDAALIRAVKPLEDEEHYYEQSIESEWDPSISGSTIRSDDTGSDRSSLWTLESEISITGLRRQRIGHPVNPVHVSHIGLDPKTGEFTGLPPEWRKILLREDERAKAAAALSVSTSAGQSSSEKSTDKQKMTAIKLVVVGPSGKLKQRLLITYVTNKSLDEYVPQVFDNYAVKLMVGDELYTLGLWDTTGQEDYDRLRPLSYPLTDVFMLVISTSTPSNYISARDLWAPELKHHCPGIPVLLVGILNPPDAALDTASRKKARVDKGRALAKEIKAVGYVECDMASLEGVKNVFDEAVMAALEPAIVTKKRSRSRLRLLSRIEED